MLLPVAKEELLPECFFTRIAGTPAAHMMLQRTTPIFGATVAAKLVAADVPPRRRTEVRTEPFCVGGCKRALLLLLKALLGIQHKSRAHELQETIHHMMKSADTMTHDRQINFANTNKKLGIPAVPDRPPPLHR